MHGLQVYMCSQLYVYGHMYTLCYNYVYKQLVYYCLDPLQILTNAHRIVTDVIIIVTTMTDHTHAVVALGMTYKVMEEAAAVSVFHIT